MKLGLLASIALYLIACCVPALEFQNSANGHSTMWGMGALVTGWSGIFAGVFAWYANPLWVLGLVLAAIRKRIPAVVLGSMAVLVGSSTLGLLGRELPGDEGGVTTTRIIQFLPGTFLWMASLVLLPLTALLTRSRSLPR